jgi:hypothetical protein
LLFIPFQFISIYFILLSINPTKQAIFVILPFHFISNHFTSSHAFGGTFKGTSEFEGITMELFTDKKIKALKPKDHIYDVREKNGFAIRVFPSGEKSWVFIYTFI